MQNWLHIALMIIDTEFPSYNICGHFATSMKIEEHAKHLPAENYDSLKHLARAFGYDKDTWMTMTSFITPVS